PHPHRLSSSALDRLSQSPLSEHATEMRLVLDGPLKVSLYINALSGLRRSSLDGSSVQLLAGAPGLDTLGADRLGASAGDANRSLRAHPLAVERDRGGDADDREARGGVREFQVRRAAGRRQDGHADLDEDLILADRGRHQALEPVVHLHGATALRALADHLGAK